MFPSVARDRSATPPIIVDINLRRRSPMSLLSDDARRRRAIEGVLWLLPNWRSGKNGALSPTTRLGSEQSGFCLCLCRVAALA